LKTVCRVLLELYCNMDGKKMKDYDRIPGYIKDYLDRYFSEYHGESLCEKVTKPLVGLGGKTILERLAEGDEYAVVDFLNRKAMKSNEPRISIPL
jgi:hypothetical protein